MTRLRYLSIYFIILSVVLMHCGRFRNGPEPANANATGIHEPKGGLYPATLKIFDGTIGKGVSLNSFEGAVLSVDDTARYEGKATWRWNLGGAAGVNVLWGGWQIDTMVFWANENSVLSFWVRPSNDRVQVFVSVGYMGSQYKVSDPTTIGKAGTWRLLQYNLPRLAAKRALNTIQVSTWHNNGGPSTIHIADFKITNVRLYAGLGQGDPVRGVFADQIGYDVNGIKTFSAEEYEYYEILRVSDNTAVHKGTDRREVASRVMNNSPVYIGDFTAFKSPGHYYIRLNTGTKSHPFRIANDVYDATLRAAIRFFYYQRNNTAIEMPYAEGPWVHKKDEKEVVSLPKGAGTKVVRHGWHDAGDPAIYMPNHTNACFWMASAWDDFRYTSDSLNIPESGDGVPDILNELHWGLDWIVDMQDEEDGGFYHNMCVKKNSPFTYGVTTPMNITGYELTNKTTAATATATGVLAYAAYLFEEAKFDVSFAEKMREAALKGWDYLVDNPQQILITEGCETYQDQDDIHARFFAAAALFLATGENRFHQYVLEHDPGSEWISDYNNQTIPGYLLYLKSRNGNREKQEQIRSYLIYQAQATTADRIAHPFGFVGYYYWGSLGTAFARVANYSLVDWRYNKTESSMFTVLQQLHYTFGQNSLGFVYFSGFGINSMKNAYHHWLKALNATPHNFPGMLPGGPNENPDANDKDYPPKLYGYNKPPETPIDSRYADTDSWSTNEIAVNQSSQLLYVLSAAHAYAHSSERRMQKR